MEEFTKREKDILYRALYDFIYKIQDRARLEDMGVSKDPPVVRELISETQTIIDKIKE